MCCQAFSLDGDIFVSLCLSLCAVKSRASGILYFCLSLSNHPFFSNLSQDCHKKANEKGAFYSTLIALTISSCCLFFSSVRCAYVSKVTDVEACPRISLTAFTSAPAEYANDVYVCLAM